MIKIKEHRKKYGRDWREQNPKYMKEYGKKCYLEHKEEFKKRNKEYYTTKIVEWRKNNPEKLKIQRRDYKKGNIIEHLRSRFYTILKIYTKTGKIMSSKKYGIDYKAIIDFLMPLPENLENYHVHHIKPLFTFNFTNEDGSTNLEEVKKAFAPENHRLLLAEEHRKLNHFNIIEKEVNQKNARM